MKASVPRANMPRASRTMRGFMRVRGSCFSTAERGVVVSDMEKHAFFSGKRALVFSSYQRERERGIAQETGYAILAFKKKGISGDDFAVRKVPRSDRLEDFTRVATGCTPLV